MSGDWDLEVRPHLTPYFAYGAAALILAAHVTVGVLLKISSTGVIFQTADQVAIALLGVVIAGAVLLFARPRLRVGAPGVAVRNLLGYRLIPWSDVVGVTFPRGARWARVDLPDDEYIPVMAIQAVDKDRAVEAMDNVRGPAGPLPARPQRTLSDIATSSRALVPSPGTGVKPRLSYTPLATVLSTATLSVTHAPAGRVPSRPQRRQEVGPAHDRGRPDRAKVSTGKRFRRFPAVHRSVPPGGRPAARRTARGRGAACATVRR